MFFVLLVLWCAVLLEGASYFFGRYFLHDRGMVFAPVVPEQAAVKRYLDTRDPLLGWPFKGERISHEGELASVELDDIGSRRNTYYPDTAQQPCVSTYGDSFAFSSEVKPEDAWPNQLSRLLGCRVNNFGVGGYGSDQAVLRFESRATDRPRVAILSHLSENIVRNINQFRFLISGREPFGFKPRFVMQSDGSYAVEPLPVLPGEDYADLYRAPDRYLRNEYFLPDGPSGITYLRFPYTLAVGRSFFSYKFRGFFENGRSYIEPFYDPDHPAGGLQVTRYVIQRFNDVAAARAIKPLIVILPVADDLFFHRQTGRWPYDRLLTQLEADGMESINFGAVLAQAMEQRDICDFYQRHWYAKNGCSGHFNAPGYLLLAENVAQKIRFLDPQLTVPRSR